jgi:uncharacterized membrane protein YsdA (DUF1294 family)
MLLRSVDKKGLFLWFVFSFIFTIGLKWIFHYDVFFSLLISLNVSTFLVMLIDKIQATQAGRRLSERSLYLMTFLGGSVGMICAMYVLRHKSRKWSFQVIVWLLVFIQFFLLFFLFSPSIPSF